MKVRIVEKANGYVYVEVKKFFRWTLIELFSGEGAWDKAKRYAGLVINPKIEYIK